MARRGLRKIIEKIDKYSGIRFFTMRKLFTLLKSQLAKFYLTPRRDESRGTDEATVRRPLKGSVGQAGIMGCAPFMPRRTVAGVRWLLRHPR